MAERKILDRKIEPGSVMLEQFAPAEVGAEPVAWLKGKATDGMVLLAHADDGVIWGRVRNGEFDTPQIDRPDFKQVTLRPITLQMARLFDETTEIFLWRVDEGSWRARQVTDAMGGEGNDPRFRQRFDEYQVLWGTGIIDFDGEFSLANDGEEEFHHAPPVGIDIGSFAPEHEIQIRRRGKRNLRLKVRHYLESDGETGWLRVAQSRLVGVEMEEKK